MKIIDLEQNSPMWLAWRMSHITATMASIILGNNPWKSSVDLYDEILGTTPTEPMNDKMKRGQELEPIARQMFIEQSGIDFVPICCESSENTWQAASLDGWNDDNQAILEIKSPSERTHNEALLGIVPIYYRDQVMHQLAVTGGDIAFYVTYHPDHAKKLAVVEIKPDVEYINHLIEAERSFYYDNLCNFRKPDPWKFKRKN